jgi:Tfp pilus assembly protein PilX
MQKRNLSTFNSRVHNTKARGIVLIMALIILALMTLGGLSLMRTMETTTMVAGNITAQQSAISSSDAGIESAIAWLESHINDNLLNDNNQPMGYSASSTAMPANISGADFWNNLDDSGVCTLPRSGEVCSATITQDSAGNIVQYMIQRLCNSTGPVSSSQCGASQSGGNNADGENQAAGEDTLDLANNSAYYRITVRVTGYRNTVSYVQAVVNL